MEILLPEKMVFKLRRDLIIRDKQGVLTGFEIKGSGGAKCSQIEPKCS